MSNPNLSINVAGALGLAEIADFWRVDFGRTRFVNGPTDPYAYVEQPLGKISFWIHIDKRELLTLKDLKWKPKWNCSLRLSCPTEWNPVRDSMAAILADHLAWNDEFTERKDGALIAWLDTGEILFIVKNQKLIFNKLAERHLCFPNKCYEMKELRFGNISEI